MVYIGEILKLIGRRLFDEPKIQTIMWESLIIVSVILVYIFTRNQKKESEKEVKEETQFEEETEKMVNRLLSQEVEEKEEKTNSLKDRLYRLNRKPPLVVIVVVTSLTFILTYNIFKTFK